MAIHFKTSTPKKLLSAYKKAVDDGHVRTWSYDGDGDFNHCVDQWAKVGWLRPKVIESTELIFYILCPVEKSISTVEYAVYHGRFIESMLTHCESLFEEAYATAMPRGNDIVGG